MLLDKGINLHFVRFDRVQNADSPTGLSFEPSLKCHNITLNPLRECNQIGKVDNKRRQGGPITE